MSDEVTGERLDEVGVLAVLRAPSAEHAVEAVDALVAGGITGIEVTFTTPDAAAVIAEVERRHGGRVLLGAGTVTREEQVAAAVDAGARFLVSPGTEPRLAAAMAATGTAVLLGALTPTEIMVAAGLEPLAVKIFPASLGGPSYLRAVRGPFPEVPLVPTGGVTAANLGEWFTAGALAVGAGSELCGAVAMRDRDWDGITERARSFASALVAARARS